MFLYEAVSFIAGARGTCAVDARILRIFRPISITQFIIIIVVVVGYVCNKYAFFHGKSALVKPLYGRVHHRGSNLG